MKVLSPLLKSVVYPSMARAGWFRQTSRGGLAIVTYHGVFPSGYESVDSALDGNLVTAEVLRRQLRLLKAQYNVLSPEDVLAWREGRCALPERAAVDLRRWPAELPDRYASGFAAGITEVPLFRDGRFRAGFENELVVRRIAIDIPACEAGKL